MTHTFSRRPGRSTVLLLASLLSASCAGGAAEPASPTASPSAAPAVAPAATVGRATGTLADAEAVAKEVAIDGGELRSLLLSAVTSGNVWVPPGVAALKGNDALRIKLVTTLGPLLSRVVASPAFRAAYAEQRSSAMAVPPVVAPEPPRTAKQIQDERVGSIESGVKALEAQLKTAPKESRAAMTQVLTAQRAMLAELRKNTHDAEAFAAADRDRFERETADLPNRRRERDAAIARLAAEWPEDPSALAARRLEEFLALSSTIDWGAKLSPRGGRRVFDDPALEAKPPLWKLCHRAGKPTVDAARAVAKQWLAEIGR
jgi:hypothetical protein